MLIVRVPGINGLGKTKECRDAANAIFASLNEIYSNEKGKAIDTKLLDSSKSLDFDGSQKSKIFDVEEIHLDNENLEEQEKLIYENSLELFEKKEKIIFLGGDHSISFSIGKAFSDYCEKNNREACLIVFDAHADCMIPVKNPTHEEWLRALIDYGFPAENILLVGARNYEQEEIKFLTENKIKKIEMNELMLDSSKSKDFDGSQKSLIFDVEEISDTIMEFSNGKELYVSFDIDVVDPAFAPSTYYKEPGGLTARQALYIISRLARMKNLKAFDIVEVNSEEDKSGLTVKLAAKLLAELL